MTVTEHAFFRSLDWLQPDLADAEQLRRGGNDKDAQKQALDTIRQRLKESPSELPRLDLCGDLTVQADALLERRISLLNKEIHLDTPVDWGKLSQSDSQRNWHLGYHYWINALAHRYAETAEERYARQWRIYVEEFLDGCPYSADARGYWPTRPIVQNDLKTCNLGENGGPRHKEAPLQQRCQWMSLSCHFRIETWLAGLSRLVDSPQIDDAFLVRVLESLLNDHAYVCVLNPRENTPNQFTAVTLSLLKLSLLLPMHRSCASTFLIAWERLQRVFNNNLFPDGSDIEQSPDYNAFLLDLCMEVLELLGDAPESRRKVVHRAALTRLRFLTGILMPGNRQPPIGKGHNEDKTKALLKAAKSLGDAVSIEALVKGTGPLRTSLAFPYGGYHCLRDDNSYLLFKNSRAGSGHMHEDCLSFILWANGHELLTDPSHFTYNTNTDEEEALNAYALGTRGHNSIRLGGLGQRRLPLSKSGPRADDECPLLRASEQPPLKDRICKGKTFSFLEGSYADGYGPDGQINATHHRVVITVHTLGWLVIDRFHSLPDKIPIQQHWHLADHFQIHEAYLANSGSLIAKNKNASLLIQRLDTDQLKESLLRGSMDPVQGWVFPNYGDKVEAWELVWESTHTNQRPLLTWIEAEIGSAEAKQPDWEGNDMSWETSHGISLRLSLNADKTRIMTPESTLIWEDSNELPKESDDKGKLASLSVLPSQDVHVPDSEKSV